MANIKSDLNHIGLVLISTQDYGKCNSNAKTKDLTDKTWCQPQRLRVPTALILAASFRRFPPAELEVQLYNQTAFHL